MNPTEPVERPRPDSRVSYAQNAEDILLDRLFHGRPGTFMDVGANHPFVDNNTYFFYLRGWRGVNVEPAARGHALFEEFRPGDRNLAVAVSDAEGELPFFEIAQGGELTGLSTLSAEVADEHRAQGFEVAERRVPVRTLASLIDEHRIEPPDLLTIDVENHEGHVIRGIPLADWRPRVLVVESTAPLSERASFADWEPILLEHGYLFAAFNGVNRFYLRDDLRDALSLFATPVNALDRYLRHEVVDLSIRADALREQLAREQAEHASSLEQERAWHAHSREQHEKLRQAWEWGRVQAQHAQACWEQECASFARERAAWAEALAYFERSEAHFKEEQAGWATEREALYREREAFERERAGWRAEREHHHEQIAGLQRQLRPYQLLDRLRVVPAGYGLARRVKRRLAS